MTALYTNRLYYEENKPELTARIELATSTLLVLRYATKLGEPCAFGGNRTPANCLEGSYDTISPRTLKEKETSDCTATAQEYESCALPTELI